MKKYMTLFALSASMLAVPAMAMPSDGKNGGDVTRAAAQANAAAQFVKLDGNKDGKFDAADRAMRQAQRQDARFAALDGNKDGSVSKAEFDQARVARDAARAERRAKFVEQRAERAASGAVAAAVNQPKAKRAEHRIAGRSGHGGMRHHGMRGGRGVGAQAAVTQTEFVNQALVRFDRMDADKNGILTASERQTARADRRGQRGERRAAAVAQPAK